MLQVRLNLLQVTTGDQANFGCVVFLFSDPVTDGAFKYFLLTPCSLFTFFIDK